MFYQLKIGNTQEPAMYTLGVSGTAYVLEAVGAMGTNPDEYIDVSNLAEPLEGSDIDQLWTFVPEPGGDQGEETAYMIQDAFGHRIDRQVMMGYNHFSNWVESVSIENPGSAKCWWIPKRDPVTGQTNFFLKDVPQNQCLTMTSTALGAHATIDPYIGSPAQRFDVSVQYGQTYWGPSSPYQASYAAWRASAPIPPRPNQENITSTLLEIAAAIGTNPVPATLPDKLDYWRKYYDGTTGNGANGASEVIGRAWAACEAGHWDDVDDDLDPSSEYTSGGAK